MSTFEATLSICIVFISLSALLAIRYFQTAYYDMGDIWLRDREKIKKLTSEGVFDSILIVDKFNEWFVNNKNPDIYANAGIYLRLDKLCVSHIEDYIRVATDGVLDIDNFNWKVIKDFEIEIRNNWQNQLRAK